MLAWLPPECPALCHVPVKLPASALRGQQARRSNGWGGRVRYGLPAGERGRGQRQLGPTLVDDAPHVRGLRLGVALENGLQLDKVARRRVSQVAPQRLAGRPRGTDAAQLSPDLGPERPEGIPGVLHVVSFLVAGPAVGGPCTYRVTDEPSMRPMTSSHRNYDVESWVLIPMRCAGFSRSPTGRPSPR